MFKQIADETIEKVDRVLDSGRQKLKDGLVEIDQHYERLKNHRVPLIWNGWVRPTASFLMLIRFSLLVAIVCGSLLIMNSQAQELLRTLVEGSAHWPQFFFAVAAVLCAFTAWYWARVALYFRYDHIVELYFRYDDAEAAYTSFTNRKLNNIRGKKRENRTH